MLELFNIALTWAHWLLVERASLTLPIALLAVCVVELDAIRRHVYVSKYLLASGRVKVFEEDTGKREQTFLWKEPSAKK